MRSTYFHDVLKAFTDSDLNELFMAWVDKNDPKAPDAYRALYRLGHERGLDVLLTQIRSGEFAVELRSQL